MHFIRDHFRLWRSRDPLIAVVSTGCAARLRSVLRAQNFQSRSWSLTTRPRVQPGLWHHYGHGTAAAKCLQWTGDSPTRWSYGCERSFGYIWRSMVAAMLLLMCCEPDTFNPLEVHQGSCSSRRQATNGMRMSCQQCRSAVWSKSRSV